MSSESIPPFSSSSDAPPATQPSATSRIPPLTIPDLETRPWRVLVVDDDLMNRESLSRRLKRRGMDVDVAADGTEALEAIRRVIYDLILLDVMMPGLSGLEVLERLRHDFTAAELPIIMATANNSSEDIAHALALGANDYVTKPIDFTVALARVNTQLDLRRSAQKSVMLERHLFERNAELEAANARLLDSAERTKRELSLAAKVQASFLPREDPDIAGLRCAWRYVPCQELAGDALNVCVLDDTHVGFYVLDVSGHGVAASLNAVSAARLLAPAHDPDSLLVDRVSRPRKAVRPADVAREMSKRFEFNTLTGQFLTCFYAVLDLTTLELTYVSAGHPGAILISADTPPRTLEGSGLPIGLGETYDQQTVTLAKGDRLYLYSDGALETMNADHDLFGGVRLAATLAAARDGTLDDSLTSLFTSLDEFRGKPEINDDISVLALECV